MKKEGLLLIFLLVLGVFSIVKIPTVKADVIKNWADANYDYRILITINSSKINVELTDFPVYVYITPAIFNFSRVEEANGEDIRFYDWDNTTELKYDMEEWNTTVGTPIRVKIASISNTSDTNFWIYYGYSGASSGEDTVNTWMSTYVAIWNMVNSSGIVEDGTGNRNLTIIEGGDMVDAPYGGRALYFDGIDDYASAADIAVLDTVKTIEVFFTSHNDQSGALANHYLVNKYDTDGDPNGLYDRVSVTPNQLRVGFSDGTTISMASWVISSPTRWHYVVGQIDGSFSRIYVNATLEGSGAEVNGLVPWSNNEAFYISGGIYNRYTKTSIAWIRLSSVTITGDWMNATYYSETNQLLSFGSEEEKPPLPEVDSLDIPNIEDGDYLFYGVKYNFTAKFKIGRYSELYFNDTVNTIKMGWDNTTLQAYSEGPISLMATDVDYDTTWINVTWIIMFTDDVIDASDRVLTANSSNAGGANQHSKEWGTTFNIHNLGYNVTYERSGGGEHVAGGDAFEIKMSGGTFFEATVIKRRFQHLHMLFSWDTGSKVSGTASTQKLVAPTDFTNNNDRIEIGVDYLYNGSWVEGWWVRITKIDGEVGRSFGGTGADASWVKLNISWWTGSNTYVKEDQIYTYHEGYVKETSINMSTSKHTMPLWVDLWFNKMNGSSVVGGRVNSYYHGMKERGTWWFGYGDFVPMIGNVTQSMFFENLIDSNGNIIHYQQLELIRVKMSIHKGGTDGTEWTLRDFDIMEWKIVGEGESMQGIDTPVFVATKMISMPQTGFVSPIVTAIKSIGKMFTMAIVSGAKILIGMTDDLLVYFGLPQGFFSGMVDASMEYLGYAGEWLYKAAMQASNIVAIVGDVLVWVTDWIFYAVKGVSWIVNEALTWAIAPVKIIYAIITAGTVDLGPYTWDFTYLEPIMQVIRVMAPIIGGILIFRYMFGYDLSGRGEMDVGKMPRRWVNMFNFIREGFKGMFFMFTWIKNRIIDIYNFFAGLLGRGSATTEME